MPIKHKWGYLAIACICCGFGIVETALGGYLYNITRYSTSSDLNIAAFLTKSIYARGIGGWWAAMVVVIAGGIGIAAVVQPKSQKAFVLATCIASGIGAVLSTVSVVLESIVYTYSAPISACVTTYAGVHDDDHYAAFRHYGNSADFDGAEKCMKDLMSGLSLTSKGKGIYNSAYAGNCFCVSRGDPVEAGTSVTTHYAQCSMINNAYTSSNCSLSMSFNSRQLSSICFGALDIGIAVCLFVYSIVILVEQPPIAIANDKAIQMTPAGAAIKEPTISPVPTMKI